MKIALMSRRRKGGDTVAPTVAITSIATSPTLDSPVTVTITFSEAVTGFVVGDITISAGGSLANFATADNIVFTVSWTLATGANMMDIAAGVCTDAAGNENAAADQFAMTWGITVPSITPSLGSEEAVNGAFASDTGWTKGTGWTIGSGVASSDGSQSGNSVLSNSSAIVASPGTWYQIVFDLVARSAGTVIMTIDSNAGGGAKSGLATYTAAGRSVTAGRHSFTADLDFVGSVDNASRKAITFSSMRALLGARSVKNGTYQCTPTVVDNSQTGILIEYLNDSNFVLLVVDRLNWNGASPAGDKASLVSCINGTFSVARQGTITYSAGAVLKCVVNGTTHQLFYNGAQVGADVVIDNSGMGLQVHGFNSLAGNSVGTVTTSP